MTCLLDPHTFIWTILETTKLSANAKSIITDMNNTIYVSTISFWELSLKTSINKFSFGNIDIRAFPQYARAMNFSIIDTGEVETITFHELALKKNHKDPFDRMLIWQAITKDMLMISKDKSFSQYTEDGLKLMW